MKVSVIVAGVVGAIVCSGCRVAGNGALDGWGHAAHWFARPEDGCVEVKDGCVHLKVGKGADGQYPFREAVSHVPEFILISTECKDYRKNMLKGPAHPGLPAAYAAKDAFVVDFVRVYECVK